MKVLCPITDWKSETGERGRGIGKESTTRRVIAADCWNWCAGIQRGDENGIVSGDAFVGSMKMLFPYLRKKESEYESIVKRIIEALETRTGKKMPQHSLQDAPEVLGGRVDRVFGTSYFIGYPPKVMKTIFQSEGTEE